MRHVIPKLYSQLCDFPLRDSEPRLQYMLATIPRSGSSFFAIELWRTGVLGAPMEYLNPIYINMLVKRCGCKEGDVLAYWDWVKHHRTSPNGVFGFKAFTISYTRMSNVHPEWLSEITPQKVVFLTRLDLVEQAVSYSKAIRSNLWFAGAPGGKPAEYDREHITSCLDSLHFQLEFWSQLFDLTRTEVCCVHYEDLLNNLRGTVTRVADFIGVPPNPRRVIGPPLIKIQRDMESSEWVRRYQGECETGEQSATHLLGVDDPRAPQEHVS